VLQGIKVFPVKYLRLIVPILGGLTISSSASGDSRPWSGAVTPTSAIVKARISGAAGEARLAVSRSAAFTDLVEIQSEAPQSGADIATFKLTGLHPGTQYHYAIRENGSSSLSGAGKFRTFPRRPSSFSFAFSSCAQTGSSHPVFTHIRDADPLFYMNVGDLHYENITVNDPARFRRAYDLVLGSNTQWALYRSVPVAYTWDDHDYAGNNSDGSAASRPAARQVYQEYVPHHPLAAGSGDVPIYQSFNVGRARFILTDLRSERTPRSAVDDGNKKMMSDQQLAWFKQEVLDAGENGQMVFWVNAVPWIQQTTAGSDSWGGYSTQRREIADFLARNRVGNLVILGGDAHMLAADSGANANYSTDPGALRIPVLHAGALDRDGSVKGGPYSHGTFPNQPDFGQYGLVTVDDLGDRMQVHFSGRAISSSGVMTERIAYTLAPLPIVLPGDANADGRVDIADLGVLAANWQASDRRWMHGDFNYDGKVDIADLGVMASYWQRSNELSFSEAMAAFDVFDRTVVPEPAAAGVLLALWVCGLRRRGR
jgi:hypothetical protein